MAGELKQIKDFTEQTSIATTDWMIVQTLAGLTKKIAAGLLATVSTAQTLSFKQFTAYRETVATPAIVSGVLTLDLSTANVFNVAHNANITTLTISNPPASGISCCFVLNLTQDATGGRTFIAPASCVKSGGTALVLSTTANKRNKLIFDTTNGGTSYDMALAGKDYG